MEKNLKTVIKAQEEIIGDFKRRIDLVKLALGILAGIALAEAVTILILVV